ncbi:MAG: hypothetical protein PHT12_00625 [Patescibacteria group bacterium]|nr:hypothetical protein [Patescibacteria group bacterium]
MEKLNDLYSSQAAKIAAAELAEVGVDVVHLSLRNRRHVGAPELGPLPRFYGILLLGDGLCAVFCRDLDSWSIRLSQRLSQENMGVLRRKLSGLKAVQESMRLGDCCTCLCVASQSHLIPTVDILMDFFRRASVFAVAPSTAELKLRGLITER